MEDQNNSRRFFLKTLSLTALGLVISPLVRLNQTLADLVSDKDPLVKALKYVPDAKKSTDRKDKSASCSKCQFFGDATGKAKQAKCQLIPSGEVMATGWCQSYSPRPTKAAPKKS